MIAALLKVSSVLFAKKTMKWSVASDSTPLCTLISQDDLIMNLDYLLNGEIIHACIMYVMAPCIPSAPGYEFVLCWQQYPGKTQNRGSFAVSKKKQHLKITPQKTIELLTGIITHQERSQPRSPPPPPIAS
jgi:hypothetical protein